MATFIEYDNDTLVQCPYNPDHMVAKRKFIQHLTKCEKSSSVSLEICRFNASHRYPKEEIRDHEAKCEDNRQIIREMVIQSSNDITVQTREERPSNQCISDDWENELLSSEYIMPGLDASSSFNGKKVNNISLQRMTKTERKKYYANQIDEIMKKRKQKEK